MSTADGPVVSASKHYARALILVYLRLILHAMRSLLRELNDAVGVVRSLLGLLYTRNQV